MSISLMSFSRRLFITRDGYIGLGPGTTQAGDAVYVLRGSNVPFVLRQSEAQNSRLKEGAGDISMFTLVGDCYIHGVMDREYYEGHEDDITPLALC
jgi:hypothetical protein